MYIITSETSLSSSLVLGEIVRRQFTLDIEQMRFEIARKNLADVIDRDLHTHKRFHESDVPFYSPTSQLTRNVKICTRVMLVHPVPNSSTMRNFLILFYNFSSNDCFNLNATCLEKYMLLVKNTWYSLIHNNLDWIIIWFIIEKYNLFF